MRTQSYIHFWGFDNVGDFTLSDASLITARGGHGFVTLKLQRRPVKLPGRSVGFFSTADDIFVRSRAFAPTARTSWDFIELRGFTPKDQDLNEPTSLSVRLHNGTDSLYWNGATWAVAGAGDWNTETVLNANLSAYDGDSIAIEVRLRTTDEDLTPALECVGLRWTGEVVDALDEFLYNGLVTAIEENVRPLGLWLQNGNGTTSIEIGPKLGDAAYDVTGIAAIYNQTTDPGHETNLLVSYAGTTATLSTAIASDERAYVVFEYRPTVAVTTSSDFEIGARVPAIWITDVSPGEQKRVGGSGPSIVNRTLPVPAGSVFLNPIPFRDITLQYAVITPTARDLLRLSDAMHAFITANPVIIAPALDYGTSLRPGPVPSWSTDTRDEDDTRLATGAFILKNVPTFGDPKASAAGNRSRGVARIGPVNAGDPDYPGVGYGVARINVRLSTEDGGDETITVTE